ncbi:MAG: DUF5674 family protein [Candidatus Dojkabacteria bacterium]
MKEVKGQISKEELKEMASKMFGNLVKAVVDVEKEVLVVDAELHSDQEAYLLEQGSKQENLWGINIYPDLNTEEMIEFDSMINLRPSQGNNSREVENEEIQRKILDIVNSKIEHE